MDGLVVVVVADDARFVVKLRGDVLAWNRVIPVSQRDIHGGHVTSAITGRKTTGRHQEDRRP